MSTTDHRRPRQPATFLLRHCERVRSERYPSALRALYELCEAPIGVRSPLARPPMAARCNGDGASPELQLFQHALFGRDSLRVADLLWPRRVDLTRSAVLSLAALQGSAEHSASEEEVGRIPHEIRPPASLPASEPGAPGTYYGSVDATPMFCVAVTRLASLDPGVLRTPIEGRSGESRSLGERLGAAVEWTLRRLDASPVGLLESRPVHERSIENQVWKDSHDSYSHSDGTLATRGTIASVEVQALVHDALFAVAAVCDAHPDAAPGHFTAEALRSRAAHLRTCVLERFWLDDERRGFFALALDRDALGAARPLAVRSSNMGHLLDSGILDGPALRAHREAVAETLFAPDMLCAAGVRTLSEWEIRYWPASYHNGSTWPWDTYVIARGLHRHGYHGLAWELVRRIWALCDRQRCFPEFAPGTDWLDTEASTRILDVVDARGRENRLEQPPQEIQAWTVAAVLAAKAAWGDVALRRREALPLRATDPLARAFEDRLLSRLGPRRAGAHSSAAATGRRHVG